MVQLNHTLYERALKTIHEAKDCADIYQDLRQINDAISQINLPGGLGRAQRLDQSLREKYPDIAVFLKLADALAAHHPVIASQPSTDIWEVVRLKQDYCGIVCHAAVKKGITQTMEQMIDRVD